jgi:YjbE family integral membrane protein
MNFLATLDWGSIVKIIGVDIMLGVDNAVVIALACAALPKELRTRAMLWGTAGAVGLRAVLLAFAGFIMAVPFVKLVAGAYLLYLGYKLLNESGADEEPHVTPSDRVFTAVKTVIIADFMMSLDNVLAVAAAANGAGQHSTLYAIAGIVLSIPVIVFGANMLMGFINKFPVIVWVGAGLLGWVGAEMIFSDPKLASVMAAVKDAAGDHAHLMLNAGGFALVILAVLVAKSVSKAAASAPSEAK